MLYIIIDENSGILLNIYRCLTAANYRILSNRFGKRTDGKAFVELNIEDGAVPLPPAIESALLNIEGCKDILYEKPADISQQPANKNAQQEPALIKKEIDTVSEEIINNFSGIEKLVQSFSQRHQEKDANYVFALGHAVGSLVYQNDYALGKPLKLELALKRMLSDAVKSFGKIKCNGNLLSIESNIFCRTINPNSHCDFTRGFVQGFLHESPATKEVKVDNIACRCRGQSSCSFEIH